MLSADDRANILGEPVAPKSVFDFLSSKDKERLQGLSKSEEDVQPRPTAVGPAPEPEVLRIPTLDSRIAQSALKGFMPYGDDPAKQARYKAFLQHFAMPQDPSKPFKPSQLSGKTISEQNAELEAFANAAMIFKPMSGMMANRFTSSSQTALLDVKAPEAGLHVPKPVSDVSKLLAQNEEERQRKSQQEREAADPRRAAVREGNFGPLTRTVEPWYPARLLCKRFNVADPHPEGAPQSTSTTDPFGQPTASQSQSDVLNSSAMDSMMQERKANNSGDGFLGGVSFSSGVSSAAATPPQTAEVAEEDDVRGQDVLSYEKPSIDIFKAIFASDDEDEDDADEDESPAPTSTAVVGQTDVIDDPSKIPDTSVFDAKRPEAPTSLTIEDLASFKPTFISRSDRATTKDESKKKDKKQKKKAPALVSFDLDEGGDEEPAAQQSAPAARKRKSESKDKEDKPSKKDRKSVGAVSSTAEEDEWVEKEVASVLPSTSVNHITNGKEQGVPSRKNARVTASELF